MEEQKQDQLQKEMQTDSNPSAHEENQPLTGEVVNSPPPPPKKPNALASTLEEALEKAKSQGTSLMFFGGVCIFLGASFLFQGGFSPFAPILWVIGLCFIIIGIQVRKNPFIKVFLFQGALTLAVGLIFLLPFNRTQHSGDLFDLIIGAMATAQGVLWIKEYLRYREL